MYFIWSIHIYVIVLYYHVFVWWVCIYLQPMNWQTDKNYYHVFVCWVYRYIPIINWPTEKKITMYLYGGFIVMFHWLTDTNVNMYLYSGNIYIFNWQKYIMDGCSWLVYGSSIDDVAWLSGGKSQKYGWRTCSEWDRPIASSSHFFKSSETHTQSIKQASSNGIWILHFFAELLEKVGPLIHQCGTEFRKAILSGERLAITLRYFSYGTFYGRLAGSLLCLSTFSVEDNSGEVSHHP